MKMDNLFLIKLLLLTGGFTIELLIEQFALADIILPGSCHMGECYENKLIEKTILRKTANGILYSIRIASRSWPMGTQPNSRFGQMETNYVYCSTTKPAYIFKLDGIYYAHLLNPGGEWFRYNVSDYPIYWSTCHNFVGPDFFSEKMTAKAIKLGYPLNLPSEQIELNNVLEIMN